MESSNPEIIPILLSGGVGKRLWPLSRSNYPKQFLRLYNDHTLLQNTLMRCQQIEALDNPILVCSKKDRFTIASQLDEIAADMNAVILEEQSCNTAPAIAIAALYAMKYFTDPLLLVMPIDHKIDDINSFSDYINLATPNAEQGNIVTFGVTPLTPNTNYGYIEVDPSEPHRKILPIRKFIEKPNATLASQYIADKSHFWNSGIYLFKASRILAEYSLHQPEMLECARHALETCRFDLGFLTLPKNSYTHCPCISFDYAIMEKAKNSLVIPMNIPWIDIGNWQSLYDIDNKDMNENVTRGNILSVDTKRCYLRSEHKMVAAIGLSDCCVIETRDAVLIANKQSLDSITDMINLLDKNDRAELSVSSTVYRPWGYYISIESSAYYQIKKIVLYPKQSISLQEHQYRSEHWIILKGSATVTLDKNIHYLQPNESIFVPIGMRHRITNNEDTELELIEIQTGTYLSEEDIKRFEDLYHRELCDAR